MSKDASGNTPKAIAVLSQKGGQGKSAVAVNVAHELSCKGYNVAVADFDPNGHLTSDLDYREHANNTDQHFASYTSESTVATELSDFVINTEFGWDFIPNIPKESYAEWETYLIDNTPGSVPCVKPLFDDLKQQYHFVIIDTGPTKTRLIDATLESINYCMIPIRVGDGEEVLISTIHDLVYVTRNGTSGPIPRLKVLAIFPTFVQQPVNQVSRERLLIEKLCQSDSTGQAVPNFAYISVDQFEQLDAGEYTELPRPGVRKARALDNSEPLREVDSSHEQLVCFEELAAIAERGYVDRSAHPHADTASSADDQPNGSAQTRRSDSQL
jgi:chromosome partitioning protein